MKNAFKKLAMQSVIGLLVFEALVGGQVFAQTPGLHDTVAQTGSVYLVGSSGSDGVVTKFDPASTPNPYTATNVKTYSGAADALSVSFMPNGDMVVLKAYSKLYCYTYVSNYADDCSWSTSSGYTVAGSNVLIAFLRPDALGNIWASNYGLSPIQSGREVYKIVTSTPPSQFTYDASFGNTVNFAPFPVTIDHSGHIWFSSYADQSNVGNSKIYCLTQDMNPCTGGNFDANGGIDLGTPYFGGLTVGSDNMLYAVQYGPTRTVKKINPNGQIIASTTTPGAGTMVQSITLDADNNVWLAWTDGSDGKLSCFKSSDLTPCIGVASPQFNDLSQATFVFVDNSYNLWVGSMGTTGNSRLYCFKSTNGTACETTGNFVQDELYPTSYYLVAPLMTTASFQYQIGDQTGMIIAGAFAGYAADANATITATVDPTITFNVTSTCNLPNMNATTISGCAVTSTVSTNGLGGYVAYVTDSSGNAGALKRTGSLDTIAVSDGSILSTDSGEAGFGVTTSQADRIISQHSDSCASTTTVGALSVSALTTGPQSYASSSTVTDGTGDGLSTLCVRAKPSATTPAGSYTTTLTLTAVASF